VKSARPREVRFEQRQATLRTVRLVVAAALDSRTHNLKEPTNKRADFDKLDAARVGAVQREAAAYQSNLEQFSHRITAIALARKRYGPTPPTSSSASVPACTLWYVTRR